MIVSFLIGFIYDCISKTLLFILYLLFKEGSVYPRVFLDTHLVTTDEDACHIAQELLIFYGLGLDGLNQTED